MEEDIKNAILQQFDVGDILLLLSKPEEIDFSLNSQELSEFIHSISEELTVLDLFNDNQINQVLQILEIKEIKYKSQLESILKTLANTLFQEQRQKKNDLIDRYKTYSIGTPERTASVYFRIFKKLI